MMDSSVDFDVGMRKRFWAKVSKTGNRGCWLWTAAMLNGYGRFGVRGANRLAHRVSYTMEVGPVPEGMDLDHKCQNKACVNPAHLRLATRSENVCHSSHPRSDNTTGYVGVTVAHSGKFVAQITHSTKKHYLGTFPTAEAAHIARTKAEKTHHGKFACRIQQGLP